MLKKYAPPSIFFLTITSLVLTGCISQNSVNRENAAENSGASETIMENGRMDGDGALMDKSESFMEDKSSMMKGDEGLMETGPERDTSFQGRVLAGSGSPVIDFNQADYNMALVSGKSILLYFYADWCPICREEVPKMYSAFNALKGDDIVAFRVNFKDNDTDANEEALAREFGVAYQHTKVFLKDGQRVLKSPESWDEARYLKEIAKVLETL